MLANKRRVPLIALYDEKIFRILCHVEITVFTPFIEGEGGRICTRTQVCDFATFFALDDVEVMRSCHVVVSPCAGRMERMYCYRIVTIAHMVRFHIATEIRADYVLVASLSAEVRSLRFPSGDDLNRTRAQGDR